MSCFVKFFFVCTLPQINFNFIQIGHVINHYLCIYTNLFHIPDARDKRLKNIRTGNTITIKLRFHLLASISLFIAPYTKIHPYSYLLSLFNDNSITSILLCSYKKNKHSREPGGMTRHFIALLYLQKAFDSSLI